MIKQRLRQLLRSTAAFLTACQCVLATAYAQAPPSAGAPEAASKNPALPYTVAILSIFAIIWVICAPSRKS